MASSLASSSRSDLSLRPSPFIADAVLGDLCLINEAGTSEDKASLQLKIEHISGSILLRAKPAGVGIDQALSLYEMTPLNSQNGWAPINVNTSLGIQCVYIDVNHAAEVFSASADDVDVACRGKKFLELFEIRQSKSFERILESYGRADRHKISQEGISKITSYIQQNIFSFSLRDTPSKKYQRALFERSLTIEPDRVIVHFNKNSKGDLCYGKGAFKKVHAACVFPKGEIIAIASCPYSESIYRTEAFFKNQLNYEYKITSFFQGCVGIIQPIGIKFIRGKEGLLKAHIELPLYQGDLFSLLHYQLTPLQELSISRQLLEGLWHFKDKKIVNRDVKIDNIMYKVGPTGNIEVAFIDFGAACHQDHINRLASNMGTVDHFPPELCEVFLEYQENYSDPTKRQFTSRKFVSVSNAQRDMWSFGCVLYHIIKKSAPEWFLSYDSANKKESQRAQVQNILDFVRNPDRMASLQPAQTDPKVDPLGHLLCRILVADPDQRITIEQIFEEFVPLIDAQIERLS